MEHNVSSGWKMSYVTTNTTLICPFIHKTARGNRNSKAMFFFRKASSYKTESFITHNSGRKLATDAYQPNLSKRNSPGGVNEIRPLCKPNLGLYIQGCRVQIHQRELRKTTKIRRDKVSGVDLKCKEKSLKGHDTVVQGKIIPIKKDSRDLVERKKEKTAGVGMRKPSDQGNPINESIVDQEEQLNEKAECLDESLKEFSGSNEGEDPQEAGKFVTKENEEGTDQGIGKSAESDSSKNENLFIRRGRQIKIRLPSIIDGQTGNEDNTKVNEYDDSDGNGTEMVYRNTAAVVQPESNHMKRVYLVNQRPPFGLSKEKSFTVVFPDDMDKVDTLVNSNPVTPGWLSPVPFSKIDLSLAYITPEHSPLTSPAPTSDHICHLKPTFFRK